MILFACGQDPRKHAHTNAEFRPYVSEFEKATMRRVVDVPINFDSSVPEGELGVCVSYRRLTGVYREILIAPVSWSYLDYWEREMLVFHELGHCVLGRKHDSTLINGWPRSLMYPQAAAISSSRYKLYRDYYVKELTYRTRELPH